MDKNTTVGLALIGVLLVGAVYFSQPSETEKLHMAQQDSIAAQKAAEENEAAEADNMPLPSEATAAADSSSIFHEHRRGSAQDIVLENEKVKVTLNTKGATVAQAEIKGHKSYWTGNNVLLFTPGQSHMTFALAGKTDNIISDDFFFTPVRQTENSVTLAVQDGGKALEVTYSLLPGSFALDMDITAKGLSGFFAPGDGTMSVKWIDRIAQQEKGRDFENRYSSLTYKRRDSGTKSLDASGNEEREPEETLDWVAFKNQFFSAALISYDGFTGARLETVQDNDSKSGYLKTYKAQLNTKFDPTGKEKTSLGMYLGTNDFHELQKHNGIMSESQDLELEELVDLGWPIVRWINRWFIIYLFDWLSAFGLNMGLVLLLLTLIVKVLVFPTNKKSYMSSVKMKVLKPQIDALSAKYPKQEDAMKKQQEMMQVYSSYGVSPMGGCLPMLIQSPVWIALFNFVPNAIELRGVSFLWADDLSTYDDLISWGHDIWLIGDHLSIFCLLFCLTNIVNTWISMRQQQNQMTGEQAQQMKMMQYMMYAMPVMFFFMFNNYSSGLCYYYFLSGLSSIIIMWYLRRSTDEKKVLAKLEAYRQQHKNDPKKTSNMAARLEALQKMQAEQSRQRKNKK